MQLDLEKSHPNVDLLNRAVAGAQLMLSWLICNTSLTLTRHLSEDGLKTVMAWKYTGSIRSHFLLDFVLGMLTPCLP